MATCICCGEPGQFSIRLAVGPQGERGRDDDRYYIPNQGARERSETTHDTWFCHPHMRAVEDAVRATILYHQAENGVMQVSPKEGK